MYLPDASDTEALGADIAAALLNEAGQGAEVSLEGSIHLSGQLGAGKTTLVRGLVHALGIEGPVKSPTYTLVEPYAHGAIRLYHFDLYRIGSVEEFCAAGFDEYLYVPNAVTLIEWPEKIMPLLDHRVCHITIDYDEDVNNRAMHVTCVE